MTLLWATAKVLQSFYLARPHTIINGLQYSQSLSAEGILVAGSAVFS